MSNTTHERLYDQVTARTALLALASHVTDLPAVGVDICPDSDGVRLAVHVHNNPNGFEWWREALSLDPANATTRTHSDFCTVQISGAVGSISVSLVGYLPLPAGADAPVLSAA